MKFINGWKFLYKDANRFHFGMRFGVITIFEFYYDISDSDWRIVFFNYGVKSN